MERQLPKNVRQIGNVSDSSKIYVEDYVDTFFNQLCDKAEQKMIGAFLVGETVQEEENDYIYVYGAIQMQELELKGKDFVVSDGAWKKGCETCKEFFGNAEILGWFITGGEHSLEVNHNINKIHQKYFSREKSIFITKNTRDKEEKFYIYKFRDMMECSGHYIYYEKNLEMQNYMISTRKKAGFTPSELIEDRAIKNFRSIIQEKTQKSEQKSQSRFVYGLSTALILIILVIGVTMINNYDKMQSLSGNVAKEGEKESDETVETLGDIVNPEEADKTDETDTPEGTDKPDETDVPEETDKPDETDAPEGTDKPDETDTPEEVDKPDETDTPEETDKPDETDTPEETDTPADPSGTSNDVAETEVYIVKKGDTLESICNKTYGDASRLEEICELNGLEDGNLIFIGQKLLLP